MTRCRRHSICCNGRCGRLQYCVAVAGRWARHRHAGRRRPRRRATTRSAGRDACDAPGQVVELDSVESRASDTRAVRPRTGRGLSRVVRNATHHTPPPHVPHRVRCRWALGCARWSESQSGESASGGECCCWCRWCPCVKTSVTTPKRIDNNSQIARTASICQ